MLVFHFRLSAWESILCGFATSGFMENYSQYFRWIAVPQKHIGLDV